MTITAENHTYIDKNFININFPETASYGSIGGPSFFTEVNSSYNGYEQRKINWSEPRMQYNVSCNITGDLGGLLALFRGTQGRAKGFLFKDWSDYIAQKEVLQPCSASNRIFHFTKTYAFGSARTTRRIFRPHNVTINVYVNDNIALLPFTINYEVGIVEFDQPVPQNTVVMADFQFDVPVRFDSDHLGIVTDGYKKNSCNNIKMIELKFRDNCS